MIATFRFRRIVSICIASMVLGVPTTTFAESSLRLGAFEIDATPPMGSPLAYNRMTKEGGKLSCRGIVLLPEGQQPIVLTAIDWIGLGNEGYTEFRQAVADAAETSPKRVAMHALHQHDAPRCDFTADAILTKHGLSGEMFDVDYTRKLMQRLSHAVRKSIDDAVPVTHVAHGQAEIEQVASNRRILGDDGKVLHTRYTATRDPKIRAFPAGTIDPMCKLIAFWNEDKPVAVLTYYATHPQSYYRTGSPSPDFPGIARNLRAEAIPAALHVHFNGAGGNIGAGKWNDGSPENRLVLAKRVADGMAGAWQDSLKHKEPITADDIAWNVVPVALPVSQQLSAEELEQTVADPQASRTSRIRSAVHLAWLRRCEDGYEVDISCLTLGKTRVLHLPGELFVEYQLAAQKIRPDLFIAMAAYGDYAPGYIGTAVSYGQGGYEVGALSSRVSPRAEEVLLNAVQKLLE